MTPKKIPARSIGEIIATQIAHTRDARHWSQQRLADEMEAIGAPIDRSAIAKIESGRRGVSAEECVWLAEALGVAPYSLLLPHGAEPMVMTAPKMRVSTQAASMWMRGQAAILIRRKAADDLRFYFDMIPYADWKAQRRSGVRELQSQANAIASCSAEDEVASMKYHLELLTHHAQQMRDNLDLEYPDVPADPTRPSKKTAKRGE